eukprot:100310_1
MTSEQDVVEFILAKGGEIREMKASGSTKDVIMKHVEALQKLKQIYEEITGETYVAPGQQGSRKDKKKKEKEQQKSEGKGAAAERKAEKNKRIENKQQEVVARSQSSAQAAIPDDLWRFGDSALVQSSQNSICHANVFTELKDIGKEMADAIIWVRARIHTIRDKGKGVFLLLRQTLFTIQAVMFSSKEISKAAVRYIADLPPETVVDIKGIVKLAPSPIQSATQSLVELHIQESHAISRSSPILPFQLDDAASRYDTTKEHQDSVAQNGCSEGGEEDWIGATVSLATKLDYRWIDLRVPSNQAIFRIQSGVCHFFREFLNGQGFMEIHSPKLISGASEGGANVFTLDYFGSDACLAQSPQLYKQITSACSGFRKVYEIGSVFRAEKSNTHRHLTEFTGLDLEMVINSHYCEVMDLFGELFIYIFDSLNSKFKLELEVVCKQYPFEPLEYCRPTLRLSFFEGIALLQQAGYDANPLDDLNTEQEKALGNIVKKKYGTDFFIMDKYPLAVRPFYSMPCPEDGRLSNTFDIFIRGEEITSGGQRIHIHDLLEERAKAWEVPLDTIHGYLDSFKHGAEPHGGGGIGLERVVMLFLDLHNIRRASLFPRDPRRIAP